VSRYLYCDQSGELDGDEGEATVEELQGRLDAALRDAESAKADAMRLTGLVKRFEDYKTDVDVSCPQTSPLGTSNLL